MAVDATTPARVVEDARLLLRTVRDEVAEGRRPYVSDIRRLVERGLALRYQQYVQFLERYGFLTLDRRADLLAVTRAGEQVAAGREGPLKGLEDDARHHFGDLLQEAPMPARRSLGVRLDTRYLRLESIGRGGLGRVWRGRLLSVDRPVAIKMLDAIEELFRPEDREKMARRFERAVRAHAQLVSPYIVQIFDQNAQYQPPYFVMELAPGGNLRGLLAEGPLEPAVALRYFIQIALGLKAAHAMGVVHRDLKPENVLLDASGNVKLSDFGVTRVAERDGGTMRRAYVGYGSVGYMAPELLRGEVEGTPASDIYALGILLYEMLTGSLPGRRSPLPSEVVEGLPTAVDDIFDQMARDDLGGRLATIDEVLEAVYGEASICGLLTVRGAPAFIEPPRTLPGLPPGEMPEADDDDERDLAPTPPPASMPPVSEAPIASAPTSRPPSARPAATQRPGSTGAARAPSRGPADARATITADDDEDPEPAPAAEAEPPPETVPPAAGMMADPIEPPSAAADDDADFEGASAVGPSRDGSVDASMAPSIDDVSIAWTPRKMSAEGEVVVPRVSPPVEAGEPDDDDEAPAASPYPARGAVSKADDAAPEGAGVEAAAPGTDAPETDAPAADDALDGAALDEEALDGAAAADDSIDDSLSGSIDGSMDSPAPGNALDGPAVGELASGPARDEAREADVDDAEVEPARASTSAAPADRTPSAPPAGRGSGRDRPMPRASVAPRPNAPRPRTTLTRSGPIDVSPIRDRISRSVPYPAAPARLDIEPSRSSTDEVVRDDATDRTAGFAPIDDSALEAQSVDVIAAVGNSRIGDLDPEDETVTPDPALIESIDEVELLGSEDAPLDVAPAAFDALPASDDDDPSSGVRPVPRVISAAPSERRPYVAQGTQVLTDDAIEFVDDSSPGVRRPYVAQGTQVLADDAIEYVDDEDEDQTAQSDQFRTVIHGRTKKRDPERTRALEERLDRMTGDK